MEINIEKLERQKKGAFKFFNSKVHGSPRNYWGILAYETGVGKTMAAQIAMQLILTKRPIHNIYVLVPSEAVARHWTKRNESFFESKHLMNITVMSANALMNSHYRHEIDLLVIDEIHEFYTPERFKLIDHVNGKIKFNQCLGLTATPYHKDGRHNKVLSWLPIVDKITQQEALDAGFISKFIEYNLKVYLTDDEQIDYDFYSDKIKKYSAKFGKQGFSLAAKILNGGKDEHGEVFEGKQFLFGWCVHKGWHPSLNSNNPEHLDILKEWSPNVVMGYATELMKAVRERTNIMYNSDNKLKITLEIIQKLNTLKTICFGQSTNFADRLNLTINREVPGTSVVYHSKLETVMGKSPKTGKTIKLGAVRQKKMALEAIESGDARVICTASSLDKGFDVKDISLAITCAGTQNPVQAQQRGGRAKRLSELYQTDDYVLILNLYVPNTRDESWLKKRQEKYRHTVYWIDEVEEITYDPKTKYEFSLDDI